MRPSIFLCVSLFVVMSGSAQITLLERQALLILYKNTGGLEWLQNENWLEPVGTECRWHGVECAVLKQHVIALDLSNNNLMGTIPAELKDLSFLKRLCLNRNRLQGQIPTELGTLKNLQCLVLSENRLSGPIPSDFGRLFNLEDLWIDRNNITGPIPRSIGRLRRLQTLFLSHNALSGMIPPELTDLSNLTILDLGNNQLEGIIPPDLGRLTQLTTLGLYDNRLERKIPCELGRLSHLYYLFLYGNRLVGRVPDSLMTLRNLQDGKGLDLRWNGLHTENPRLARFINRKHRGGPFRQTQTAPPSGLMAVSCSSSCVRLRWAPIHLRRLKGGIEVLSATVSGGPYRTMGVTKSNAVLSYRIDDLDSGETVYFVIRRFTMPHDDNLNKVVSEYSPEVAVQVE